ncbi:NAD(P)-binding protein [Hyphopichia burtonii NRRL Y-1933]|uniref:NAD(P)-binding protein n=1 Tax=Hyphopichia burtonii NRRL Y-1933 TaxID=984485 RepID=A0A1E4REU1_9ASCO|nr:NAD(P)-binding protein [Hyphopichia burtonii NRRL Y-1933]ODV65772.1 NAD(P)-binding protein [Hyphopichia burtonii NRRL Y-1933]
MVKNLLVFGAHGKVGQQLVRQIANYKSQYQVTAVVRNTEQATILAAIDNSLKTKQLTVDTASVQELADTIKGHHAVVFAAGSAGKDLLKVDLDGAVKTFEASVLAQVKRYILVSAIHADIRESFQESQLRDYLIAKHYADRILVNEFKDKLDFTILKPTYLSDEEASGKIRIINSADDFGSTVSRANVAKVILEIVDSKNTFGRSYDFEDGDSEISNPATFN